MERLLPTYGLPKHPFDTALRQIIFALRRIEDELLRLLRRGEATAAAPATLLARVEAVGRGACGALAERWPAVCDLQELLGSVADLKQFTDERYPWQEARRTIGAALELLATFRTTTESIEELARQTWGIAPPDPGTAFADRLRTTAFEIVEAYGEMCNDLDAVAGIVNLIDNSRVEESTAAPEPLPERLLALFPCRVCGTTAGVVAVYSTRVKAPRRFHRIHVFSSAVGLVEPVAPELSGPLEAALAGIDAGALVALEPRWAPFYCEPCRACYCGEHWTFGATFDRGHYSGARALCPRGHLRTIEGHD